MNDSLNKIMEKCFKFDKFDYKLIKGAVALRSFKSTPRFSACLASFFSKSSCRHAATTYLLGFLRTIPLSSKSSTTVKLILVR